MKTPILVACIFLALATSYAQPTEHDVYEREIARLKEKITTAEKDKVELTNQLAAAAEREAGLRLQITNLNSDLSAANEKIEKLMPLAVKAVTLPVKLARRNAVLNSSYVYVIQNHSGKNLRLTVTCSNGSASKVFSFVADTMFAKEIGHTEGWAGADGDTVIIESSGYAPLKFQF